MEGYAKRGVFRGFSKQRDHNGIAAFRMIWHGNRVFDLIVDTEKKTILIPVVLPTVPVSSPFTQSSRSLSSRTMQRPCRITGGLTKPKRASDAQTGNATYL
jgi:hypothetical protein